VSVATEGGAGAGTGCRDTDGTTVAGACRLTGVRWSDAGKGKAKDDTRLYVVVPLVAGGAGEDGR
jgi:hypothetical protein